MGRSDDRAALIELIYEAAAEHTLWPSVINKLTDLVGGGTAQLSTFTAATGIITDKAPRMSPEALLEYTQNWLRRNPYIPQANQHMRPGAVYHDYSLLPRDALRRMAIYNEFFAVQELEQSVAAKLLQDETGIALVAIWRNAEAEPFGTADTDLLASLLPHLQQALRLAERLAAAQIARDAGVEVLDRLRQPVLLVDGQCRVMFANAAAEAILTTGAALHRDRAGILRGRRGSDTAQLHRLVAGAGSRADETGAGGTVQLPLGDTAGKQTVLVVPLRAETDWLRMQRPAAMLFLSNPTGPNGLTLPELKRDYGLTRMEAAVALQLLDGQGLPVAAAKLGIALTTARTHLSAIFAKTGARTQIELVRLLLQNGAVIRGR